MSTAKSSSSTLLKSINQQKVLFLIFSEGPISRVELAQRTGLSHQTVANIAGRLLEEHAITETQPSSSEAGSIGRKRVPLSIHASYFHMIGIELAAKSIRGSVYNLKGEQIIRAVERTERYENEEHLLLLLHGVIGELLKTMPDEHKVKGIGISVKGLVDSRTGCLLRTPGLGWQRIPLKDLLEDKHGLPVYLENDVNLLAVNENMKGTLRESVNNVTLMLDYGIGGAIVLDKKLITGSTFVAGEFGHYKGFHGADALECFCGGQGCLTTLASISGLAHNTAYTLDSLKADLADGMPEVIELADKIIESVSAAIANVITILNPDRILLCGRILDMLGSERRNALTVSILRNIPQTCRGLTFDYLEQLPDGTELAAGIVLKHAFEVSFDTLSL
ncbi:ROK family transcriptional regulator [Paenibacillus sp. FJAT-26967]|uniref:ROK family transcriptional regulator n=1 Tax=Paenibacillus sp. FJAT-26967 TaxID=1729690 RepID=UPI00083959CA|nr:ROK family transcriptional regulator [Paenibacillus sp. FJAT-26967]